MGGVFDVGGFNAGLFECVGCVLDVDGFDGMVERAAEHVVHGAGMGLVKLECVW